ncbi:hypothetical protein [Streptomyces noursei]|uniref:hypothetical protein n=1 Tax=Streptomyces noursei TaxID=1971 RepID=UPI0023B7C6ED|nr:hypothetical protein [Streptomyces noursei]
MSERTEIVTILRPAGAVPHMSTYEPLSRDHRAALAELIGDAARPATADFLLRLGQTVKDCRTHDHGTGEDIFCGNLTGWMGERTAPVVRRLLDTEAAVEQARRIAVQLENECARLTAERATHRAAVLREAADAISALPQDYECDPGRGDSAELLRRMADAAGKDTPAGGESTRKSCARCRLPFDPTDTRFDGRARYRDTQFCGSCVDRCHESIDALHRCPVCSDGGDAA